MTPVFPDGDDVGRLAQMLYSSWFFLLLIISTTAKQQMSLCLGGRRHSIYHILGSTARIYALFPRTYKNAETQGNSVVVQHLSYCAAFGREFGTLVH